MSIKVIFIVPQSFLRTKENTNPFYDPIIRVIKEQTDFQWRVYLWDKRIECGYDKEKTGDYHVFEVCGIWFYRFFRLVAWKMSTCKIYRLFGLFARPFFAKKFSADLILTQAGQFADVFATMLPNRRIVDVQHGVIYSRHSGYFDKEMRLLPHYRWMKHREFWVYGNGYADCFFRNLDNAQDLKTRVKVIGDVVRAGKSDGTKEAVKGSRSLIVVASQLTRDFSPSTLAAMKAAYEEAFETSHDFGKVVFRHHPRFNNCIDLSDWEVRFPWLVMTDRRPWPDIFAEAICVVTINSTVAFDAAAYGVPTAILDDKCVGHDNLMKKEYGYPLADISVSRMATLSESEWKSASQNVKEWHERYYATFSEERCLKLLKEDGRSCQLSYGNCL